MPETRDFSYLDEEKIIDSSSQRPGERVIYHEMQKFNLRDFLHSKGASSGAVGIITSNQMIITDTFVRSIYFKKYGTHFETAKMIYQTIYGSKPYLASGNFEPNSIAWQELITEDDNILIEFSDPANFSSSIWLPDHCSKEQIEFLEKLNSEIQSIKKEDQEYFRKNPIIFECMYNGSELCVLSDLEDFIEALKDNPRSNLHKGKQGGRKWDNLLNKNKFEETK